MPKEAGDAFTEAACIYFSVDRLDLSAHLHGDAFNAYKIDHFESAERSARLAVDLYITKTQFHHAAKLHVELAACFQKHRELQKALESVTEAIDLLELAAAMR